MDIKFYIAEIKFLSLAGLYLFMVFSPVYGFFVDEISLFNFTLTGTSKNLLCLFVLFIVGIISSYPMLLVVYRALKNSNSECN
jgi:hypothetical protein